jgi:uncharacterized protein YacL
LLANPAVILGAWGAGAWLAYQWTQDQVAWPFVIMGGVAISSVMKAEQRVRAYRRWKRDWDSLGNRPPRRRVHPLIGLTLGLLLTAFIAAPATMRPTVLAGAVVAVLVCLALFLCLRMVRAIRRRRSAKAEIVAICVGAPLMRAPTLQHAYAALPDHCKQLA